MQIKTADMLAFYARYFDCLEVNFTYYRMPRPKQLEHMIDTSGGTVEFVIKAHQSLTHERPDQPGPVCRDLLERLRPVQESGLLSAILLQFPFSFKCQNDNRDYLAQLRDYFSNIPLVIEFRHESWISDETFALLEELGMGFCCVDEPALSGLMPRLVRLTSQIGYIRFHGRNATQWWHHEHAWERYHYSYTESELIEWVPAIHQLDQHAGKVFVFANNHYNGHAATNSLMLKDLLGIQHPHHNTAMSQMSLFSDDE
ncbi:DUF72 domain-containing protein [bacterium]|nr:DUF72 domain-containing protein [bacterium]